MVINKCFSFTLFVLGGYIKTTIDRNNNIYVSGQGDSIPVNSNHDIITMKFNSSGVYQWSTRV
ncbi:MAG: hypothetical protein IPP34_03115 [Bacteroidetes bacterium]|nr:hypothetical protein [Bacteroidota bacterium]